MIAELFGRIISAIHGRYLHQLRQGRSGASEEGGQRLRGPRLVTVWFDQRLLGGQSWDESIERVLTAARRVGGALVRRVGDIAVGQERGPAGRRTSWSRPPWIRRSGRSNSIICRSWT
jgi:hypothetical protein